MNVGKIPEISPCFIKRNRKWYLVLSNKLSCKISSLMMGLGMGCEGERTVWYCRGERCSLRIKSSRRNECINKICSGGGARHKSRSRSCSGGDFILLHSKLIYLKFILVTINYTPSKSCTLHTIIYDISSGAAGRWKYILYL